MRYFKRMIAVLCAALLLLPAASLGEARLLPQLDAWRLDTIPVSVTLSAQVGAMAEFDQTRTDQINALLRHISLVLYQQQGMQETWGKAALQVDGREALSLTMTDNGTLAQAQLSCIDDTTYTSASGRTVGEWLLGAERDVGGDIADSFNAVWLADGYRMLDSLPNVLHDFCTEKSVKTTISKMGTARLKQTISIPADNAAMLTETMASLCAEQETTAVMAGTVYSGKQKFELWRDADGQLLKAVYTGNCGADEEHLRKVTLTWLMRRDDDNTRDDISVKSPAVKGTDRNTVIFKRTETIDKNGTVKLTAELTNNQILDKVKTIRHGSAKLNATAAADGVLLDGEISVGLEQDEDTDWTIIRPALTFANDRIGAAGTVQLETRVNKRVTAQVDVTVDLREGDYFEWLLMERSVDMDALMANGGYEIAVDEIGAAAATALIRQLVQLPYEDTLFLSAGLDEATWQMIVDAAKK